jgi:hypothetical protein
MMREQSVCKSVAHGDQVATRAIVTQRRSGPSLAPVKREVHSLKGQDLELEG